MKKLGVFLLFFVCGNATLRAQQTVPDLSWAFAIPGKKLAQGIEGPHRIPGSAAEYTQAQIDNPFNQPDWFPDDHPPMPHVVQYGDGHTVQACIYCHLASGLGHPQSANLTGLSVSYMLRQLADFKSGARQAEPMNRFAKALTDEDARQAAAWFASLPSAPWTKVVETDTVPRTYADLGRLRLPLAEGGTEPLGNRIIEIPQDVERVLSRDPRSGFVSNVPFGSIAKGEQLVTTGDSGKTTPCATCHGPDLHGMGSAPKIAGRFAIYIFRQLYSIQTGTRAGAMAELMKPVVENLSVDDMLDIAAYVASQAP